MTQRRRINPYNAMVHDRALRRRAEGLPSDGRGTLPQLAREVAAERWEDLPEEEKQRLLNQLRESQENNRAVKKVPMKSAAVDVGRVGAQVNPELDAVHNRTGAEYILLILRGNAMDNWQTQVYTSPRAVDACTQVFKATPGEIAARVEGYIIAGIEGKCVRRELGGKKFNLLKAEIRSTVYERFRDICIRKGFSRDRLPKEMQWAGYNDLVATYGVKLVGWTEPGGVRNPGELKGGCAPLQRLLDALKEPEPSLHWEELSEKEWEACKEEWRASGGKRKGRVTRPSEGTRSAEVMEDEDDSHTVSQSVMLPTPQMTGTEATSTEAMDVPDASHEPTPGLMASTTPSLLSLPTTSPATPCPLFEPEASSLTQPWDYHSASDNGDITQPLSLPSVPFHTGDYNASLPPPAAPQPSLSAAFSGTPALFYPGASLLASLYSPLPDDGSWYSTPGMDLETLNAIAEGSEVHE
ncbi:hypothetical protein OBBRIDRAFT_835802 [Obba rivulosa]|uniref:Uncharacterized protein n=1 Tax=Obba rivulosa TaxID=1052685 RepID=A0A8E2DNC5_9APHY|nr:hypothetical protein OBBRIDRAFT_835802 [Obba rivulosa]